MAREADIGEWQLWPMADFHYARQTASAGGSYRGAAFSEALFLEALQLVGRTFLIMSRSFSNVGEKPCG